MALLPHGRDARWQMGRRGLVLGLGQGGRGNDARHPPSLDEDKSNTDWKMFLKK